MTAPKTDRRILRTRALLRQGLAELMQEKNAGDITVKELVAHANVNRSTFYLHYTDIDQMLASVEAELLERIEASVQAHPIDPHQAQIDRDGAAVPAGKFRRGASGGAPLVQPGILSRVSAQRDVHRAGQPALLPVCAPLHL